MIRRITARVQCAVLAAVMVVIASGYSASASPFGQGVFGADVPFGSNTSMAIALDGVVTIAVTAPGDGTFIGTGAHTVTVTSTDVVGYRLYMYAPDGTAMVGASESIPASANGSLATLAENTWGYNTTGSDTNFVGVTAAPVPIRDATGPFKNGDITTITYGLKTNSTKAAGNYAATVVYTAVNKSE